MYITACRLLFTGYPATVSLVSAEQASGGPFSPAVALAATQSQGAGGSSGGGGLSKGKKAAAIAVPVIVGALLAACKFLIAWSN